jgi:hypothetical protein
MINSKQTKVLLICIVNLQMLDINLTPKNDNNKTYKKMKTAQVRTCDP